jgi:hypothetical protein
VRSNLLLAIRTGNAAIRLDPIRRTVTDIFPDSPRLDVATGRDIIARDLGRERVHGELQAMRRNSRFCCHLKVIPDMATAASALTEFRFTESMQRMKKNAKNAGNRAAAATAAPDGAHKVRNQAGAPTPS